MAMIVGARRRSSRHVIQLSAKLGLADTCLSLYGKDDYRHSMPLSLKGGSSPGPARHMRSGPLQSA
jgi:hypothetical protein